MPHVNLTLSETEVLDLIDAIGDRCEDLQGLAYDVDTENEDEYMFERSRLLKVLARLGRLPTTARKG